MNRRLSTCLVGLCLVTGTACVPMAERSPPRGELFTPLHQGELSEFDHLLAIDRHTGGDDQWTDLGEALLRLVNCEPLRPPTARVEADPISRAAYSLALLEEQRRHRVAIMAGRDANWSSHTIHAQFLDEDLLRRDAEPLESDQIRWPVLDATWPDELPAPLAVESSCDGLMDHLESDGQEIPLEVEDLDVAIAHLILEWRRSDEALTALRADAPFPATFGAAHHRLMLHRADVALALAARGVDSEPIRDEVDAILTDALAGLLETSASDDLAYHARVAWLAIHLDEVELALHHLPELTDIDHPAVQATASYYFVKLAWRQGAWQLIADTSPKLLEEPRSLRAAHAYFVATAHLYTGEVDKFLGIARDALRQRRGGEDDPFLGALYRLTLRELARFEVDERTEELLEEFGPRGELNLRILEFAESAIDLGRPDVATEMVEPLLAQTTDGRRLPRLHAVLALAAFLRDDRPGFDHHMEAVVGHRDELHRAIPARRRASFFSYQDNELARVLRTMIPIMAEWGDDPTARAQRQRWLVAITETTQAFLRRAPETAVSDTLTDLYHLAGQLLEEHPRGYAERVGAEFDDSAPLILGTVQMAPVPPLDRAPQPRLRWAPVYSLLMIPQGDLPPQRFSPVLERFQEAMP